MGYFVDVTKSGGDAIRAYRKIKRRIKQDRFIEELRDRQYYKKPSEIKREKRKQAKRLQRKKQAEIDIWLRPHLKKKY
jgi:small subunit ribosomal protein S21